MQLQSEKAIPHPMPLQVYTGYGPHQKLVQIYKPWKEERFGEPVHNNPPSQTSMTDHERALQERLYLDKPR